MVEKIRPVTSRRTIVAAAFAAGMAAYIYWIEQPRIEEEQAAANLLVFDPERVDRIELRYPNEPKLVVERIDDSWRLLEPADKPADENTINLLVRAIRDAEVLRRVEGSEAEDLSTYGLDGDGKHARISLRLDDGEALPDIIVGRMTPVGYQAFVRIEGRDELVVTPLLFHSGVKKTAFELRSKLLYGIPPDAVRSVKIDWDDAGEVELVRDEKGWMIAGPAAMRADADTVTAMLSSLNLVTALAFYEDAEDDLDRFGLNPAVVEFEVTLHDGRREALRIGTDSGDTPAGFYAQRGSDGQVFKGPDWLMPRYGGGVSALKDRRLFSCEIDEVVSIEIERSDGLGFTLARDDADAWISPTRPDATLNQRRVQRTAAGLAGLAGDKVLADATPADYNLSSPAITASITGTGGKPCGTAIASKAPGGAGHYIASRESATVMDIAEHLYSRIDVRLDDLIEAPN